MKTDQRAESETQRLQKHRDKEKEDLARFASTSSQDILLECPSPGSDFSSEKKMMNLCQPATHMELIAFKNSMICHGTHPG